MVRRKSALALAVVAASAIGASAAQAAPTQLITNGSFEQGFSGWSATTTLSDPLTPWTAQAGSYGWFNRTTPQDGTVDALNGFDGNGPGDYELAQTVAIPAASSAQLRFQDRIQSYVDNGSARTFAVQVRNPTTNAVLGTVYSYTTPLQSVFGNYSHPADTGWQTQSADLSAWAGQTVKLDFVFTVPQDFTGPAQAELDNVNLYSTPVDTNDQLDVTHAESQLDLDAGQTKTASVTCPSGYIATDGSALIQSVDQGTGTPAGEIVSQSQQTGSGTYTFTVTNPATGRAQITLLAVCATQQTTGGHTLTTTQATGSDTLGAGSSSATVECPAGSYATSPGYDITGAPAQLVASGPGPDGHSWAFTFNGTGAGTAALSVSCLTSAIGGGYTLSTNTVTGNVTVPAGQTITSSLVCPEGSKGIVAGYGLPAGVVLLGDEAQPVTRVFTLTNTGSADATASLSLLCLSLTTAGPTSHMVRSHAVLARTEFASLHTASLIGADVARAAGRQYVAVTSHGHLVAYGTVEDGHRSLHRLPGAKRTIRHARITVRSGSRSHTRRATLHLR